MPLTAGLRDEENERINNILKRLIGLDYVPEFGTDSIDEILKNLGLDIKSLLELSPENMVSHIQKLHFDWENAERFADFLVSLSAKLSDNQTILKTQAVAIYNYIQTESKTFSFDIFNKIASAKTGQ
ncbi:MAG TPA: hypothetical protein VK623_01200 [Flavobacterium sp.]|nr:hypothetical protein [Flavobacterium sp.]